MANRKKEPGDGPEITIVIGTLNRPTVVTKLLDQLIKTSQRISLEVFVIDQSTKENYEILKKQFPDTKNFSLLHFEKPNTCKYLNRGWQEANAPILLYLDDDVEITDQTIQAHIDAYDDETVQGVAGRVINDNEPETEEQGTGQILWCGAIFIKNFSAKKKMVVDFPYGCNMSFRTNIFDELGGFDERLAPPIYSYNEVDMGVRVNKKYKNGLLFVPEALVYHHQYERGGTRNDFDVQKVFECNQYNYGYFLGKNYSWMENIICFGRRIVYQLLVGHKAIPHIWKGLMYAKKYKI